MDIEDSYVVRIYRREPPGGQASDPPGLIGLVENPDTGRRWAFHDIEELWAVLAETGSPAPGAKRKPASTEK